jgi:outer membrane lipoprotein-sorting protein
MKGWGEAPARLAATIAAVAGACAVVAGLVWWQLGGSRQTPPPDPFGLPYQSYYFEALVFLTPGSNQPSGYVRGWFEAPARTRWDIVSTDSQRRDSDGVYLVTEDESLLYNPQAGTVTIGPGSGGAGRPVALDSNLAIGPLVSYFTTDKLTPVGQDVILGREVDIFELSPASQGQRTRDGTTAVFWVDAERRFVMRQLLEPGAGSDAFDVEITTLEFDVRLPPSVFAFVPPDGTRVIDNTGAGRGDPLGNIPDLGLAPPFLTPAYLPAGFFVGATNTAEQGGVVQAIEKQLRGPGGSLTILQEYHRGGPALPLTGTPVAIDGARGYRSSSGNSNTLSFTRGEVTVTLRSFLPFEELLRIARSMR